MRKLILTLALVGLVAVPVGVATGGPAEQKVTGGGQFFPGPDSARGAGNTISVSVRSVGETVTGNITYIDRSGDGHVAHHGTASCLYIQGKTATIGGTWGEDHHFFLKVVDDGKADQIAIWSTGALPLSDACVAAQVPLFLTEDLDRGNLKIHS